MQIKTINDNDKIHNITEKDQTRQEETRQDKTGQDIPVQDKSKLSKERQCIEMQYKSNQIIIEKVLEIMYKKITPQKTAFHT